MSSVAATLAFSNDRGYQTVAQTDLDGLRVGDSAVGDVANDLTN